MKKQTLPLLVLPLLISSLVSCGGDKPSQGQGETGVTSISAWINEGDSFPKSKDQVWKKIEEKTNVELTITGASHGKAYYDSLGMKLGTLKNVPDIFFSVPSDVNCPYTTWVEKDLIWDIDELLLNKPGKYPHIEKILRSDQYKNILYGDNMHTLLPFLTSRSGWTIYYRGEWLIKAGFYKEENGTKVAVPPVTMDEFQQVLQYFTENDPDGNGKKDTYGLSPAAPFYFWNPLYHAFGVTPDYDLDASNNVTYMYTQPEFRSFIKWAREMFVKGYIDPQYASNSVNKGDREKFYNGKTGILITNGEEHVSYITTESTKQGHNDIVVGSAPVGTATLGKAGVGGFSDWGGYWGGFSIYKDYKGKNPDYDKAYACLDLLDYLYSEEGGLLRNYGIENIHWNYDESHNVVPNIINRNDEIYEIFYSVDGKDNGLYKMGSHWGNRVHWTGDSFEPVIDDANISKNAKALFKETVEKNTYVTSKLVNFTGYTTGYTTKINKFQDSMNQYANDCVIGTKNIDNWEEQLSYLNSNCSWREIQQTIVEQARKAGIIR